MSKARCTVQAVVHCKIDEMGQRATEKFDVRWFAWREVQDALAHGRSGGIALHHFHWDLRRFGLGPGDPTCHIISADPIALLRFATSFGLRPDLLKSPRPHRPDIWHFDAFGWVLEDLKAIYPPPEGVEDERTNTIVDSSQGSVR
jgi:hypothetical protein